MAYSWLKAHDAWTRFQMESQLKDQQIAQRNQQAAAERAAIEQLKQGTQTPQQIAAALPQVIRLPQPVSTEYLVPSRENSAAPSPPERHPARGPGTPNPVRVERPAFPPDDLPQAPMPQNGGLCFPAEDAKPLFDRLADCKLAEGSLATCQANFADMKRERDDAVRARKGSFWQRAKQIGIGLAIGGAIGYAAHR